MMSLRLNGFRSKICCRVSCYVTEKMGRGQTSLGNWTLEETLVFEVPATLRDSAACAEIC